MISQQQREKLENQQYRVVGNHSAVSVCHWCKQSLREEGHCYKQKFYGIQSHRCLQMTPALICNQRCVHCWRDHSLFSEEAEENWDNPEEIIEGSIEAQRELLSGFGAHAPEKKFEEAMHPNQVAISLTGEPTLYPKLPELVKQFHRRGFTTFLVTNGTRPEMLTKLRRKELPTNLYISVEATDKESYRQLCKPLINDGWQKVNESLTTLQELETTTVIRITALKGLNMDQAQRFGELIERSGSTYVEVKGYMYLGHSRQRLEEQNMPKHSEVKQFAQRIADSSNYELKDEKKESNVVLLSL